MKTPRQTYTKNRIGSREKRSTTRMPQGHIPVTQTRRGSGTQAVPERQTPSGLEYADPNRRRRTILYALRNPRRIQDIFNRGLVCSHLKPAKLVWGQFYLFINAELLTRY